MIYFLGKGFLCEHNEEEKRDPWFKPVNYLREYFPLYMS